MIQFMANLNNKFWGQEEGQTIVEYALIIALFSAAMVASLSLFQGGLATPATVRTWKVVTRLNELAAAGGRS